MELNFNINNHVKVKLTEEGLKILESQYNEKLIKYPGIDQVIGPFEAPQVDEEGYSQFFLFELMEIFGDYVRGSDVMPFEKDIKISGEDLIEYTPNNSIKL